MARTVNEKSPLFMAIVFKDENGAALVPSTVEWRLDDLELGAEIVAWTLLPSPASIMSVIIPSSNNVINDETMVRERRAFGIRVNSTLAAEAHEEFQYHVLNLTGPSGA